MIRSAPLGEVSRFIRGVTFKPDDVCENFSNGSVVCMRTKNVQTALDTDDLISVPRSFVRRDEQLLQCGDLLVSSANSWNLVGKACWVPELPFGATAGGFISILRCDRSAVDPRFFFHWVTSDRTQQNLRSCGRQTTNISNLDLGRAMALPFPLPVKDGKPDLEEQKRIAAILDKADAIRRQRREALRVTDDFLRSLFLEMFGDPVTNPKGWNRASLGDVATFVGGGTPSRARPDFYTGSICWATSKDMKSEVLVDTQEHITPLAVEQSATNLVPPGTILIVVKSKILAHSLPVAISAVPICFGQDLKGIIVKPEVESAFVVAALRCGKRWLLERARGVNTEGLTLEHLKGFPLPLPDRSLQTKFAKEVGCVDKIKAALRTSLEEAENLFQSLQQRAFNGKLRPS